MKDGFSFLYPPPRAVRFRGGSLDIRSLSFPLEILKKYEFLFSRFPVPSRGRGLEIVFQENSGPGGEAYAIDCEANRVVIQAGSSRGRFYALSTLLQVLVFHAGAGRMPAFSLHDAPEIAFRGFFLSARPGTAPVFSDLRRLFLDLALLKFNHVALSPAAVGPDGLKELAGLARRAGLDLLLLDGDPGSVAILGPDPAVAVAAAGDWLAFFLDRCRQARAQGKRVIVWGDRFLARPEWIRKAPRDVLVLNRTANLERGDGISAAVGPMQKHHLPQALCPELCGPDRILPDARAGVARVTAACAAIKARKLAGILLGCGPENEGGIFLEGILLSLFQAGNLLWHGSSSAPDAFSLWALGHDEPDLFRVYAFLAQVDPFRQHTHRHYLFEDPLSALFSRQGDSREIVARYRKAAFYLKKRRISRGRLSDYLHFARSLCEFVADKVEFSGRLPQWLGSGQADEDLRRETGRLLQELKKLQDLFCGMWLERRDPLGLAGEVKEFDFVRGRLLHLLQALAQPQARRDLLAGLEGVGPAAEPGSGLA